MQTLSKPNKQQVRDWLKREVAAKRPPATPEQIRRELGWSLLSNNLGAARAR